MRKALNARAILMTILHSKDQDEMIPLSLRRLSLALMFSAIAVLAAIPPHASCASSLVREDQARRFGLTRAWFTQVDVNPGRNAVERAVLMDDELAILTTAGVLQVLDANTGATRWSERIGNPRYPSLGPAANETHVALINGSTLYVYDREKRREVYSRPVNGGPAAGPALAEGVAYVPLFSGQIEGFSLSDEKQVPWFYQSAGRLYMRPVTTKNRVVWATDAGYLYGADSKGDGIRYRFETLSPIAATPAANDRDVFAVAEDGYVYCLQEDTGRLRWRYATGWPAKYSPVVVGEKLYVATDEPALHCLDTADGALNWVSIGVAQFVASSPTRVYGMDRYGGLMILDGESGVVVGEAAGREGTTAVLNEKTDRLYLVSETGLVQCLHEIGQTTPYQHGPPAAKDDETESDETADEGVDEPAMPREEIDEMPEDEPEPAEGNPFGEPATPSVNPFGEEESDEETDEGNPFSF